MAKKVLLVEDSPTDASIVKSLLDGIDVEVATTGRAGIDRAKQTKPDLILLDLMLPDISGYEVCSAIRNDPALSETLVIILSIKDEVSDITAAFKAGADDYIIKPPLPEYLSRKIKLYLGIKP